jgi:hypothetical protein
MSSPYWNFTNQQNFRVNIASAESVRKRPGIPKEPFRRLQSAVPIVWLPDDMPIQPVFKKIIKHEYIDKSE